MQNSFDISAWVDKHCAKQVFAAPRKLADIFVGKAFPRQAPHMICTSPRSHVSQQSVSRNYFSMHDLVQILYSCICFCIFFHATLVRASLFASLSVHLNTVSQQAHGACQTKQKHKNKICASSIRTSMCLLHMDWDITSFTHSNFQVKLQHPGTVTAFRLCYSILSSLVPCPASSLACSAGWSTPSCSSCSCSSTPRSQSRSFSRLVYCV